MPILKSFRFIELKINLIKEYYLIFIEYLSSVHESLTDHPAIIFLNNLKLPKRIFSQKNPVLNYVNKFISTLIEAALLVSATGILCFIIYYTFGMLWYSYLRTTMADNFISLHPERADTIFAFSELNLIYFSIEVTLSAFVICFAISAACRFFHICHYLYLSQGLFGKLTYWGVPLTGAVSYYIRDEYSFSDWETTAAIVIPPTYLMFISCFKYSEKLVPEAGDEIKAIIPWIKLSYRKIFQKINDLTRYLLKQ